MKGPAEVSQGPMFIGFTINVLLYGIMITQVYIYFTTYKKDKSWMKIFVLILLVADTANTIFDFTYLYRTVIVEFGNTPNLSIADWFFATDPAITGITASLVQLFFAWRVRILTHSWLLAAFVALGSLAGGAGAIATSFEVGLTPEFVYFRRFEGVVITWLAAAAFTDVLITTILVWYLHKTGFQKSDFMVDRIIRMTVQTGLITSLVATLDLIFFLTDGSGTHLIFNFPLCKLYTNSLMSSLNSRRGWQFGSSRLEYSVQSGDLGIMSTPMFPQSPPVSPTGPPPSSSYLLKHLRGSPSDNLESPPPSPMETKGADILAKPASAVINSDKQGRPEVFVHVESHESRDNLYAFRKASEGQHRSEGGIIQSTTKTSKRALNVCLSIDTDTTSPSLGDSTCVHQSCEIPNIRGRP